MTSPEHRLKRFLDRLDESSFNEHNKKKIREFLRSRAAKGNSANTQIKYLYPLYQLHSFGWMSKPFEKMAKKEIEDIVIKIDEHKWASKTKKSFRVAIKVFYKWLEGEENFAPNEYPDKVKFICTGIPKRERKEMTFNDIITKEEVIK
ncbi:MAG: hypothetical protein HY513_00115, partial [Candidatus Aenigmarchaeota archaeon]|nr:hypothetical protein [Candidatus Aenigmarchaeota archaeon]